MNESETRAKYINPTLKVKGSLVPQLQAETGIYVSVFALCNREDNK